MADNKRLSLGGRVATPRLGNVAPPAMSIENLIARCIGARIRLTTTQPQPQTYEAHIYALHPTTPLLTLTPHYPFPTSPSLTLLPLSSIQNFTLLSLPPPNKNPGSLLIPLDPVSQNTRLRGTLARIRQDDARKGKGVSREAQDIFDAMSKTLPTKWEGENIVVLDVVVIAKPYRSENCKAGKGVHPQMLTRVRKVLESERKKLADKNATTSPRKGG